MKAQKHTIMQMIIAALIARHAFKVKDLSKCAVYTWQKELGYNYLFVGVNGSLRIGKTRSTSRPVIGAMKRVLIMEGREILDAVVMR